MTYINVDQILQIDAHLKEIFDELTPFCKDTYETNNCIPEKKHSEIKSRQFQITQIIN